MMIKAYYSGGAFYIRNCPFTFAFKKEECELFKEVVFLNQEKIKNQDKLFYYGDGFCIESIGENIE